MDRLREALEHWTDYRIRRDLMPFLDPVEAEAVFATFAAARRFLALTETGQEFRDIDYCEKHFEHRPCPAHPCRLPDRGGIVTIVVDTEACIAGWGPCNESYGFSHSCKKREGHGGFHICAICGDRRKLADYLTEEETNAP